MKILNLFLMIFVLMVISGCSDKEILYVDRPVEIKVPVSCVVPETKCDFKKDTDTEVITSMLMCIEDLRKNSEVCK